MTSPSAALVARLAAAGCIDPDGEAAEMLAVAPDQATLAAWLDRREDGEPLAWIVGRTTFCGRTVRVDPGVYVPRPQTEELAGRAAALLPDEGTAIDVCTGSGAVASHLRATRPAARVVGLDVDAAAVRCARANGVTAVRADVRRLPLVGPVDVVTAVAPYVPTGGMGVLPSDVLRWEPRAALDGGDDGLDLTRAVVEAASRVLRPGGAVLVELGGDQDDRLAPTLATTGFTDVTPWHDDHHDLRGLRARLGV